MHFQITVYIDAITKTFEESKQGCVYYLLKCTNITLTYNIVHTVFYGISILPQLIYQTSIMMFIVFCCFVLLSLLDSKMIAFRPCRETKNKSCRIMEYDLPISFTHKTGNQNTGHRDLIIITIYAVGFILNYTFLTNTSHTFFQAYFPFRYIFFKARLQRKPCKSRS